MEKLVPTHLLLGSLGSGKTTTVLELLKAAPSCERWAVFINEFGRVSLDQALIEGDPVNSGKLIVRETHGGCICCSSTNTFAEGIQTLLAGERPDRLIIEPTGLANTTSLVRQLREKGRDLGLELHSVIGHIDYRIFLNARLLDMPFWRQLLDASDHLVLTKSDRAQPGIVEQIKTLTDSHQFREKRIYWNRTDLLNGEWESGAASQDLFFMASMPSDSPSAAVEQDTEHLHQGMRESGFSMAPEKMIPLKAFKDWLRNALSLYGPVLRLKGIVKTDSGWLSVQVVGSDPPVYRSVDYTKDSRLQVITKSREFKWDGLAEQWLDQSLVLSDMK